MWFLITRIYLCVGKAANTSLGERGCNIWGFRAECVSSPSREGGAEAALLPSLCPSLFLCASGPLEHVHLSLPFVTTKNKEVNATAVLWPSQVGTLTYVWWYGNNTEVSWPSWLSPKIEAQLTLAESPTGWAYCFESEGSLNFHDSRTSVLKSSSGSSLSPTSIWLIQLPPTSLLCFSLVFTRWTIPLYPSAETLNLFFKSPNRKSAARPHQPNLPSLMSGWGYCLSENYH